MYLFPLDPVMVYSDATGLSEESGGYKGSGAVDFDGG